MSLKGGADVSSRRGRFEEVLREAIEEGLAVFGQSVKEVVLFYCQTKHGVKREDLSQGITGLMKCLEEVFSYAGLIVEHQIASILYSKLGLRFASRKGWRLIDYVEEARRLWRG